MKKVEKPICDNCFHIYNGSDGDYCRKKSPVVIDNKCNISTAFPKINGVMIACGCGDWQDNEPPHLTLDQIFAQRQSAEAMSMARKRG